MTDNDGTVLHEQEESGKTETLSYMARIRNVKELPAHERSRIPELQTDHEPDPNQDKTSNSEQEYDVILPTQIPSY